MLRDFTALLVLLVSVLVWARCDSVAPETDARLVVEAFVDAGAPLPALRLWQTRPLDAPYPFDATTAIDDAEVALTLGETSVVYRPDAAQPGRYRPEAGPETVSPKTPLALSVRWRGQQAEAESRVPPALALDSVRVHVSDEPVDGIILDSLFIDPVQVDSLLLDSLRTGAERGLVYLVEVTLWWQVDFAEIGPDSAYWIRAQLKPDLPTRPIFDDFFFRPEQILRERTLPAEPRGRRRWTGVYAVPVERKQDPLPPHPLRVAVVRSGRDYARYADSRTSPDRREPVSNVRGALGIVVGYALDSLRIQVE